MRLTTLFLILGFLQIQASGLAQKVSIAGKDLSLKQVFNAIESQTGYVVLYNKDLVLNASKASLSVKDVSISAILELVLKDQPIKFVIRGKTVFLSPKPVAEKRRPSMDFSDLLNTPPVQVRVVDTAGNPLVGASVTIKKSGKSGTTDGNGVIRLNLVAGDLLLVSFVGYEDTKLHIDKSAIEQDENTPPLPLTIVLKPSASKLEKVEVLVNTGYYEVPQERATGSFTHIDKKMLSRSSGTNILERLEGITNGLQFIRKGMAKEDDDNPTFRIRGVSTIESDESPLIVVDNFPFTGDIRTINPEDIQSVTILKDAAAASIWGAKAGNGVIIITTMKGKLNTRASISLSSNLIVGEKPDLFYRKRWLPSPIVMDIQKEAWEADLYKVNDPRAALPGYVTLLERRKRGTITEEEFLKEEDIMRNTDARNEALKYFYRNSINQQHTISASGGSSTAQYHFSAGYNKVLSDVTGNENDRLSLSVQNMFRPTKAVELNIGMWFTESKSKNNAPLSTGANDFSIVPYQRYADEGGNALPVHKGINLLYLESPAADGLLDWRFKPLDEFREMDNSSRVRELRMTAGVKFNFLKYFSAQGTYQFLQNWGNTENYYSAGSYYVRDMVNKFTQPDGTRVIPNGAIFKNTPYMGIVSQAARGQLNYKDNFGTDHEVVALVGGEIRDASSKREPGTTIYNYDPSTSNGTARFDYTKSWVTRPANIPSQVPGADANVYTIQDRDLSYFGNIAYTFKNRYILSASGRYDGSNLFGVKTNQKGTPLWSVGTSWDISKEDFFKWDPISYLRMRTTLGASGNVNKSVSHYPTIIYMTNDLTGLQVVRLISAGNPSLRWEKVYSYNAAIDFAMKNSRINGSVEFFVKNGKDLIGDDYMAPNTGLLQYKVNYARIVTKGFDLTLNMKLVKPGKSDGLAWDATVLFNYTQNRIASFNVNQTNAVNNYLTGTPPPTVGKSKDIVYALPFYGLDGQNGQPFVMIKGEKSFNYTLYNSSLRLSNLIDKGVNIPPLYGSIRSMLSWKGIQLDMIFTWKAGYVFYREAYYPTAEYNTVLPVYHQDYLKRWKKPGDELVTDVPGWLKIGSKITSLSLAYGYTENLLEKGDHIRLQDINLSYNFPNRIIKRTPFNNFRISVYAKNLGILWRDNDYGVDPDLPNAYYPLQRSISIGLYTSF